MTSCGSDDTPEPTETCTDGIQNQTETGVDCGGTCDPCTTAATCTDGIQNGDETGVDCGGSCDPCAAVANCNDGIQNGDETGVDCGGSCDPCAAVANCNDGIQNGDETGVDCGGSCDPCDPVPSCTDGIQNGNETGVDCGGSCPPCNTGFFEHITAEVNGQAYAANLVQGFDDGDNIEVNSDQSQERQFALDFPSGISTGTYDIVNTAGISAIFVDFPDSYETQSGSVTITSYDLDVGTLGGSTYHELSGTFEFTAVQFSFGEPIDTVVITNGDFGAEISHF